ncbi:MAG TPA: helix-turn-helix domain-containing protein [Vicinamibacterales bacterium]|nr:helix-turn-helix domain-containing protein [Vicinamibacterales bacterium]
MSSSRGVAWLHQFIERLEVSLIERDDGYAARQLLEQVLIGLQERVEPTRPAALGGRYSSAAFRAKEYLERNYSTPCRLIDVARSVGASTRLITKDFAASYGRTIHQHLIVTRLKAALDMLATSDEKITTIAASVGFGHVSVLYRHLHALCGAPPGVFRGARQEASFAKARIEADCHARQTR